MLQDTNLYVFAVMFCYLILLLLFFARYSRELSWWLHWYRTGISKFFFPSLIIIWDWMQAIRWRMTVSNDSESNNHDSGITHTHKKELKWERRDGFSTDNIRMFLRKMSKWNLYEIVSAYGTHSEYVSAGICGKKELMENRNGKYVFQSHKHKVKKIT